ncbi:pH-response regulator protein palA/rim20 [Irineochytrium annulatum]|nr:pH-response regulator protein palA/rim20 [Irineochytrium annulatum]
MLATPPSSTRPHGPAGDLDVPRSVEKGKAPLVPLPSAYRSPPPAKEPEMVKPANGAPLTPPQEDDLARPSMLHQLRKEEATLGAIVKSDEYKSNRTTISSSMLDIPYRRLEPVPQLSTALKAFISSSYHEDPENYLDDFRSLEELRTGVLDPEPHPASLARIIDYHLQLNHVAAKFPLDEHNIRIAFTAKDAIAKDPRSLKPHSSFHIAFEYASILFNIGVLFSRLAALQSKDTADGLKKGCAMYQNAAGAFAQLLAATSAPVSAAPPIGSNAVPTSQSVLTSPNAAQALAVSPDFSPNTLNALTQLMLALAQEMFWQKAITEQKKNLTVARLASAVGDLFEKARTEAEKAAAFPDAWVAELTAKACQFNAAAAYRKSLEAESAGKYGEAIGWLHAGSAQIKKGLEAKLAPTSANVTQDLKVLEKLFAEATKKAEKDNDIIYMELVPKVEALAPIPPACMAEEATAICHSTLISLNLPAALTLLENPSALPAQVIQWSTSVQERGGSRYLESQWSKLIEMSDRCSSLVSEAERALDEEQKEDGEGRAQFGDRWGRQPSRDLTQGLRAMCMEYKGKLESARNSDQMLFSKIHGAADILMKLSGTREQLEAALPKASATGAKPDSKINDVKTMLKSLNDILAARSKIVSEMKSFGKEDDIAQKLIKAVAKHADINDDQVVTDELKKYDEYLGKLRQSASTQEAVLGRVQTLFGEIKTAHITGDQAAREQAIQRLGHGYKQFNDIAHDLSEGLKFYSQFEVVANKFLSSCRDFAMSRSMEKQDVLRRLQFMSLNGSQPPPPNLVFSFNPNLPSSIPPPIPYPKK